MRTLRPINRCIGIENVSNTGYFLAGLTEGMPVPQALEMSAKASSIAVTRPGAVPSIPYRKEVVDALAEC